MASQAKTKNPSALREDAFQLHEARKTYLKLSMDYCVLVPQLRSTIDKLLIRISCDQWREMRACRENNAATWNRGALEMQRIQGWVQEMEEKERTFKEELGSARRELEEAAESACRPSRELEDYAVLPPVLGPHASSSALDSTAKPFKKEAIKASEKQGWLNLRIFQGKPVRTIWIRRWAFVKQGIFGWLLQGDRSGGVEESERIGVLMCNARPACQEERRFCFEIKTKSNAIMLQADTQTELSEWIGVIENAKSKALEQPASFSSRLGQAGRFDPAFAISPPSVPEFGALILDFTSPGGKDDESVIQERSPTAATSANEIDVHRKSTGLGHESSGRLRDHAARAISKVEQQRKISGHASAGSPSSPSVSGGIASLIAASHGSMPVGPGSPSKSGEGENSKITFNLAPRDMPPSTLAPSTLISPPAPTQLSRQAVTISGDRGIGVLAEKNGGMPGGLMANIWGSWNWGYVNRLGQMELDNDDGAEAPVSEPGVQTRQGEDGETADVAASKECTVPVATSFTDLSVSSNAPSRARGLSPARRTTVSMDVRPAEALRRTVASQDFPPHYPTQLRTQDAQFRLLFPSVNSEEKLALVFRAMWSPDDRQEFPGRAYVTTHEIYFFSHHLGLVLACGVWLSNVEEVTAATGRDCDFIFLHLRGRAAAGEHGPHRITIKTFLEPLKLLQRRLNYLVRNSAADEPADLDTIVKHLVKLEAPGLQHRSSSDSWEDISINTPIDNGTAVGGAGHSRSMVHTMTDLRAPVRVDGSLGSVDGQGGPGGAGGGGGGSERQKEAHKLRLPAQPVIYEPVGKLHHAAETVLHVSAKALFQVLFGDKSAVWQLLQHQHRAKNLKQGPWVNMGEGHLRRDFDFEIPMHGLLGLGTKTVNVRDYQVVDVLTDHLCYVVTDKRTAWHLPYRRNFKLVSKIVITHQAKSRSKLAIFTKVEWMRRPWIGVLKGVIDRHAMDDLELDALDLCDLVREQVRRLGPHSGTKQATQLFGHVGQSDAATQLQVDKMALNIEMRRDPVERSVAQLVMQDIASLVETVTTSALGMILDLLRWIWKTCSAHRLLLVVLVLSAAMNAFFTSRDSWTWWHERNAQRFMARMGVRPDAVMAKAVWLQDLDEAIAVDTASPSSNPLMSSSPSAVSRNESDKARKHSKVDRINDANDTAAHNDDSPFSASINPCYTTFHSTRHQLDPHSSSSHPLLFPSSSSSSSSSSSTTQKANTRISHARQNLATHRHDLLVALRMLNSMDRELVRAEWEAWVVDESRRCRRMADVLTTTAQTKKNNNNKNKNRKPRQEEREEVKPDSSSSSPSSFDPEFDFDLDTDSLNNLSRLRSWFDEYCDSCLAEEKRISISFTSSSTTSGLA